MRLIDANEIRKKAVPHTRGEHGYNANIRKWAVLVGDIDDAPTIEVPRWIPVTERLPEDKQKVLICSEKGSVLTMHYDHYWKAWRGFSNIHVTHWMPLPKPPKDGGAE